MKALFLFIFISSIAVAGDYNCNQLHKDLFAIEHQLKKSSPDSSSTSLGELELEYDKTLAQIILAEGIAHLGINLEANHNALANMDENIIDNAFKEVKQYKKNLDISLKRAAIFQEVVKVNNGKNFFDDLAPGDQELESFIISKCEDNPSVLCKLSKDELVFVKGFLEADAQIDPIYQSQNRKRRFQDTYTKLLNISINNKKMSIFDFQKKYASLYQELESQLNNFNKDNKASKLQILEVAKKLEPINVNYILNNINTDGSTDIKNLMSENLKKGLTSLHITDLVLKKPVQDNFKKTLQKIKNENKTQTTFLNDEIKNDIGSRIPDGGCKSEGAITCFIKKCSGTKCDGIGAGEFFQKIKQLEAHKKYQTALEKSLICLEKKSTTSPQKCMKEATKELTLGDIGELKKKLQKQKNKIINYNQASPLKELNAQKAFALSALKAKDCGAKIIKEKHQLSYTHCSKSPDNSVSNEFLQLNDSVSNITLNIHHSSLSNDFNKTDINEDIISQREDFKKHCEQTQYQGLGELCKEYAQKVNHAKDSSSEEILYVSDLAPPLEDEGPGFFSDFMHALAPEVPLLLGTFMEVDSFKRNNRRVASAVHNYEAIYQENLAAQRTQQENNNNGQYPVGDDQANFQQSAGVASFNFTPTNG